MKRALVALCIAAIVGANSAHVAAAPGSLDDPKGDWTSGSGPWDVKRITHDNDASTIRYTVESYTDFQLDRVSLKWEIDCTPGDNRGDDMYVRAVYYGGRGMTVEVFHSTANSKVGDGTISKAGAVVTVAYPRSAMSSKCGTSYHYDLTASSNEQRSHYDYIPNSPAPKLVHNLAIVAPTTTTSATIAPTTTAPPTTIAATTAPTTALPTIAPPTSAAALSQVSIDDEGADGGRSGGLLLLGAVAALLLGTAGALTVRARGRST